MKPSALLSVAVFVVLATTTLNASAASLSLQVNGLVAHTPNVAMCDRDVTVTPVEVLGIVVSITVSDISTACFGWTLRVQPTTSANVPIGPGLSTVVDETSETWVNLSISGIPGPNRYYWVFEP